MDKKIDTTEKLTDKAFSRLMLTSVLAILICITCLCSATWAWFTASSANGGNTVTSGVFRLEALVVDENAEAVTVTPQADGTLSCKLGGVGTYAVTLRLTEDTTVSKGFCVVTVADAHYQTAAIYLTDTEDFTFTLDARAANLTVTFKSAWGLPANEEIARGATLVIGVPPTTVE